MLMKTAKPVTSASHEELEKAYDGTLNKVNDREVVDFNRNRNEQA